VAGHGFATRFAVKMAAVACLALLSVAFGAFLLPRLSSKAPVQAREPNQEQPPTVLETGDPAKAPRVVEAPRDAAPGRPAAGNQAVPPPSAFDVPRVAPRRPSRDGACALSEVIDREIAWALEEAGLPASPPSGDAEFLRRAFLDLTGKVPTRQKCVSFLDDADPLKRARLIDELLASSNHGLYLARLWADLLVKRDFDTNRGLNPGPFVTWLAERFNDGTGWDQIVRDLITATGPEASTPATFFVLANQDNRQPSPAKLVGAVGNLFMGIQIQCAECHQHPHTARWGQNDFWGMAAFFAHTRANRGQPQKGKKANGPAVITEAEPAGGQAKAPANKKKKAAKRGPAILAGLKIRVPDPNDPRKTVRIATGKFFESNQPAPAGRPPYRPHLASWLTATENRYFATAAVNRVWAHFFARGLVNPIEDINDQNKPTHPALLRKLAESFTASGYDLKYLMRAFCNSSAYQRTSRPLPGNKGDEGLYSHMPVKVLTARQLIDSLAVVTGQQVPRPRPGPAGRKGQGRVGGDPLVRSFDTREYDDDATEFSYGIPQLLRLMNTGLTNASGQLARRLASRRQGDHARAIEEIYLTALSRRPSPREAERMLAYVRKQANPGSGCADVMWALLNCAEFISIR
jgi:hypothetical protein